MVGHVQVVLKVVNLRINLIALSLEFCKSASWFWKVQEPIDVIIC
jgi:hypothetical protein